MFLAVHAAVGAIAGNAVTSPTAAFTLGFLSHFFMDMIPHGDERMYDGYKSGEKVKRAVMYVTGDAVMTVVLIAAFFLKQDFFHPVAVSMGIVGGLLPDLIVGLYEIMRPDRRQRKRLYRWFYGRLQAFHAFHMKNHCLFGSFFSMQEEHVHPLAFHRQDLSKRRYGSRDVPFRYGMLIQGLTLALLVKVIL